MTGKTRVLVVDDEPAILRFLKPALEANDYELISAGTVAEAMKRIAADAPDIVVLDLGLPDGDGKDVIRRVREWSDVPIIVLSARDREAEKIEALDLGADDFVNKPFGVGELLARMRTALRHRMQRKAETPVLELGDLEIDNVRHRVTRAGQEIKLTPKEFELLSFLARHAGKVRHPQANPDRRLGAGAHRGHAISAGLCRPSAPEDRGQARRPADHRSPSPASATVSWMQGLASAAAGVGRLSHREHDMSPSPLWGGARGGGNQRGHTLHVTPVPVVGRLRGGAQDTCLRPYNSPHPCPLPIKGRGTLWLSPRLVGASHALRGRMKNVSSIFVLGGIFWLWSFPLRCAAGAAPPRSCGALRLNA